MASHERLERDFPAEVAIVLLICFVAIEIFSIAGFSQGATSIFPYPVDKITSSTYCAIGLLSAYELLRNSKTGAYLALLVSVFELVLGCFSIVKAYNASQLNLALASAVTSLIFGTLIFICVFKIRFDSKEISKMPSFVSSSPDNETSSNISGKCAIETVNVTKKYLLGSNVVSAVNGISMKILKGEFVAIMGPSGSGKSTMLNLIGALDKPSSGQVLIDGVDISKLDERGLARLRNEKVGFVFQLYNLIARSSVLRNMELPALVKGYSKEERLRRINDLFAIVGLHDKLLRKPITLSGGEQQRVAIARALVNEPEIVLADEPTGNVDSRTGRVIMDFLRKMNIDKRATIIVVTHDPEVSKMTDRIIYIRDGRIVKEETTGGAPT